MKEHEQLKEICEEIKYNPDEHYSDIDWYIRLFWDNPTYDDPLPPCEIISIDAREIIFTPEFYKKFLNYRENTVSLECARNNWSNMASVQLDDPVSYLHNLILWTKD